MHRSVTFFFLIMFLTGAPVATGLAQEAPAGAASCSGCHGSQAGSPLSLAGLSAADIVQAMTEFSSGARDGTIMGRIVPGFSEAELTAIAEWLKGSEK
ncbi:cytochrome C [Mesorhizobium sp. KR2-14]|uniref:c-type cytochrome n=1 Tax=Mesorhizobium sp. KR2-14 TaxID=3156610 RepID=UPI0032B352F7